MKIHRKFSGSQIIRKARGVIIVGQQSKKEQINDKRKVSQKIMDSESLKIGKVYEFGVRRVEKKNGLSCFILEYNGSERLPTKGVLHNFVYSVPLRDEQKEDAESYIGKHVRCRVCNYTSEGILLEQVYVQPEFVEGEVYPFEVSQRKLFGEKEYLVLKYEGNETMARYEKWGWVYRVPCSFYQKHVDFSEIIGTELKCRVVGFNHDNFGNRTPFPILIQYKEQINSFNYQVGNAYNFYVEKINSFQNVDELKVYGLRDKYDCKHVLIHDGSAYNIGQFIKLRISKVFENKVNFENPDKEKVIAHFKQNENYEFQVLSVAKDFYVVRDSELKLLHRYYSAREPRLKIGDVLRLRVDRVFDNGSLKLSRRLEVGNVFNETNNFDMSEVDDMSMFPFLAWMDGVSEMGNTQDYTVHSGQGYEAEVIELYSDCRQEACELEAPQGQAVVKPWYVRAWLWIKSLLTK